MRLDKYFSRKRVLELESDSLEGCLKELIKSCTASFKDLGRKKNLLSGLLRREATMTTYLGNGVALPHLRIKMNRRYVFAIGRCKVGISHDGPKKEEKIHLIILMLAGERTQNYLKVLADVARLAKDKAFIDDLVGTPDLDALSDELLLGFGGMQATAAKRSESSINKLIFNQAMRIAKGTNCDFIAVFGDVMSSDRLNPHEGFADFKSILVTKRAKEGKVEASSFDNIIQVRAFSKGRLAQSRSAFLVGITRGIIG